MKKITTITFTVMADDFPNLTPLSAEEHVDDWVDEIEAEIRKRVPTATILNQQVSGTDEQGNFIEFTEELSDDPEERARQQAEIFLANR